MKIIFEKDDLVYVKVTNDVCKVLNRRPNEHYEVRILIDGLAGVFQSDELIYITTK